MPNLVRYFTCASVLSLAGFASAASVVACSSSSTPAATPSGDDDDTPKDAGKTTVPTGDAGAKDSGADPLANCHPEGTYEMNKTVYKVTTAGKVCDSFAAGGNQGGKPYEVTIAKSGATDQGDYTMKLTGSTSVLTLLLADDKCQLAGAEQPYGQPAQDADGKDINVKFSPSHLIDIDGTKITDNASVPIDSDPAGAPGTPCILGGTTTGTKK